MAGKLVTDAFHQETQLEHERSIASTPMNGLIVMVVASTENPYNATRMTRVGKALSVSNKNNVVVIIGDEEWLFPYKLLTRG